MGVNLNAGLSWFAGGRSHSVTLRVDNVGDARFYDASSRIKSFTSNPGRNVVKRHQEVTPGRHQELTPWGDVAAF